MTGRIKVEVYTHDGRQSANVYIYRGAVRGREPRRYYYKYPFYKGISLASVQRAMRLQAKMLGLGE